MIKKTIWTALLGLSLTTQALTLDEALAKALEQSPALRAARAEAQAANEGVGLSTLWQNPELEVEAEGLGGDNNGTDVAEYSAMISQKFPMFGKSGKRRAVAQKVFEASEYAVLEAQLELAVQVRAAFAEALAQQEIAVIRDQQEKLAREFFEVAEKRHEEGGASELEVVQAELTLEEVLMEKQCCFGDLDAAKKLLASLMGVSVDEVGVPEGNFYDLEGLEDVQIDDAHPTLQRLRAQEEMTRAEATVARSRAVPDFSIGAGVKYEAADEAQSFVVAASIPLPFWNRGGAEGAAVLLRADAVSAYREQAQRDLQQQLDRTVQAYRSAGAEAVQYRTRILPKAEQAYALSRKGYDAGRYSWMELLSAQQNLAGTRIRTVEAVLAARKALAELSKFQ